MLLAVEQSFEPAADAFEAIFRQRLSVDTLERVSRRMGQRAGEFLDALEVPPADEEGELLVQTADGKGVPLVREDAATAAVVRREAATSGQPADGDAGRRLFGGPLRSHAGADRRGAVPRRAGHAAAGPDRRVPSPATNISSPAFRR